MYIQYVHVQRSSLMKGRLPEVEQGHHHHYHHRVSPTCSLSHSCPRVKIRIKIQVQLNASVGQAVQAQAQLDQRLCMYTYTYLSIVESNNCLTTATQTLHLKFIQVYTPASASSTACCARCDSSYHHECSTSTLVLRTRSIYFRLGFVSVAALR